MKSKHNKFLSIFLFTLFTSISCKNNLLNPSGHCKDGADPLCLVCGPNEDAIGCRLCAVSFINSDSHICQTPANIIENCGTYDPNTNKCVDCRKGYFKSESGFCIEHKLDGCIDPRNANECRECERFRMTDDGSCDVSYTCSIMGCSTCKVDNGEEICLKCRSNYILNIVSNNGKDLQTCVLEFANYKGCLMIKNDVCIGCKFGHYVSSLDNKHHECSKSPLYESEFIVNVLTGLILLLSFFN